MAKDRASDPHTNLAVQLAEQFKAFGVARAFGEPVRLGDETVVPVALVQYGFGGGSGRGRSEDGAAAADGAAGGRQARQRRGRGGGGGGGGTVIPLGVLARGADGRAAFRPNPLALLVCLVPVIWAGGLAAARVVRAFGTPRGRRRR